MISLKVGIWYASNLRMELFQVINSTMIFLQKSLSPNLPENVAISFYIQSYKLVLAIYHVENNHGNIKYETQQAECSVPWLNDALVLLTFSLQLCQRLKDKVKIFYEWAPRVINFTMLLREKLKVKHRSS